MEDVIVYLLIAGAVVVNIVRNYQNEVKKNKERAKTPKPSPKKVTTAPSGSTTPKSIKKSPGDSKRKSAPAATVKKEPEPFLSTYKSLESLDSLETNYNSLYKSQSTISVPESEMDEISSITEEPQESKGLDLRLDSPDDMKRAFVYSLIFDRKY